MQKLNNILDFLLFIFKEFLYPILLLLLIIFPFLYFYIFAPNNYKEETMPKIYEISKYIEKNDLYWMMRFYEDKYNTWALLKYFNENEQEKIKMGKIKIRSIEYTEVPSFPENVPNSIVFSVFESLLWSSDYIALYKKWFYKWKNRFDFIDENRRVSIVEIFNDDLWILDTCAWSCD